MSLMWLNHVRSCLGVKLVTILAPSSKRVVMSGKSKPVTVSGKVGSSKDNTSKSSSGSYLSRQAKTRKSTLEDELKQKQVVTPEDVRLLPSATKGNCH